MAANKSKQSARKSTNSKPRTSRLYLTIGQAVAQNKNAPPKEFLFDGIPSWPSLTLIVGPSKVGKTIFVENLAFLLVSKQCNFMGYPIPTVNKVLIVNFEEFFAARTSRNEMQVTALHREKSLTKVESHKVLVVKESFPRYLTRRADLELLKKLVAQSSADVVFLDSLSRMYTGAIETSETAFDTVKRLKELQEDIHIPVIIIHHTTKIGGKPITMDTMAGSRALAQEVDAIIGINKTSKGKRYIKRLAYRYRDDSVYKVKLFEIDKNCIIRWKGEAFEKSLLDEADGRVKVSKKKRIENFLLDHGPQTGPELVTHLGEGMSSSTVYENLNKLLYEGRVLKDDQDRYAHANPIFYSGKDEEE